VDERQNLEDHLEILSLKNSLTGRKLNEDLAGLYSLAKQKKQQQERIFVFRLEIRKTQLDRNTSHRLVNASKQKKQSLQ